MYLFNLTLSVFYQNILLVTVFLSEHYSHPADKILLQRHVLNIVVNIENERTKDFLYLH